MRVVDDNQIAAAAGSCTAFSHREILAASMGVPTPGSAGIGRESDREDPAVFVGINQVAELAAEVER